MTVQITTTMHRSPGSGGNNAILVLMRIAGDIDTCNAPIVHDAIESELRRQPAVLLLDVRDVSFLGVSGLAVLLETRKTAARGATELRLTCMTSVVSRPLEMLGMTTLFPVSPDSAAAQAES